MFDDQTSLRLVLDTSHMELIALRSLLVLHCHGPISSEDLRLLREVIPQLERPNPRGFAMLTILASVSADLLDDELRQEAVENCRVLRPLMRQYAYVIEGDGFRAATIRLALTSVVMLAGGPATRRIFNTLESAIEWLTSVETELSPGEVLCLRAAFGTGAREAASNFEPSAQRRKRT